MNYLPELDVEEESELEPVAADEGAVPVLLRYP
jgi:hypothetical protein